MGIDRILHGWDGQMCTVSHDEQTGAFSVMALHSTTRGPAAGGTRAMYYDSLDDAVDDATRLAEVMTMKMAAADLPMGGGKSVLALPAPRNDLDEPTWQRLLALHGRSLSLLRGSYWTGPDVGTASADMDVLHASSGFAFGRSTGAGGPGSSAPTTAHGVHVAVSAAAARAGIDDLHGKHVVVQGLGAVGMDVVDMLIKDGASITATDIDPDRCERARALGVTVVASGEILAQESDVFVPCAVGGIVDADVAATIDTRAIAGAANNVLASTDAADMLAQREIVFVPDFIANSGGAMHLIGHEVLGWSAGDVASHVAGIAGTLNDVFNSAARDGISTEAAARRLANHRLETSEAHA